MKKILCLAVALGLTVNFLLGNGVLAKKIQLTDKEVESIKTGLDLTKLFLNLSVSDEKLKAVLNMAIGGGKTGTDITYGLLVLSSFNEMEFIDMVVSQRYKAESAKYFNSILDQRINLVGYYKGIGFDLPRVLAGKITSPVAALTLNAFDITDKTLEIFTALNVLRQVKTYDGLWYYFDLRKANESHVVAWDEAKELMGGLGIKNLRRFGGQSRGEGLDQIEQQFAALYDKWGPYTDGGGVKEEFKLALKEELTNTVVAAMESQKDEQKLAEEKKPSFLAKAINVLADKLAAGLQKITQKIKELARFGGAEISVPLAQENAEPAQGMELIEAGGEADGEEAVAELVQSAERVETGRESSDFDFAKAKDEVKNIADRIDFVLKRAVDLGFVESENATTAEIATTDTADVEHPQSVDEAKEPANKEPANAETDREIDGVCEKKPGVVPARNRIIFNEVAWMGTQNSANDEWIELKNMFNELVDLNGWQILSKENRIKIVFSAGDSVPVSGFYLLERTNEETIPVLTADKIYTGALNNESDNLYLFNQNCRLEDEISVDAGWPAGDNDSKRTMERKSDFGWQTSLDFGGTPKSENGWGYTAVSIGLPLSPVSMEQEITAKILPKILISEAQIGDATSSENDFIELYNQSDDAVDISGFQLKKKTSSGEAYSIRVFPQGSSVISKGYFLWLNTGYASSGQITAQATSAQTISGNNSVALLDKDKNIIDGFSWGTSTNPFVEGFPFSQNPIDGESAGRKWSTTTQSYLDSANNQEDFEIQTPTPGKRNESKNEGANQSQAPQGAPLLSVVINEIAWSGTKANSNDEWFELYNNSTSTIDIAGWTLSAGDGSPLITFSSSTASTTILTGGFFLLERTDNNSVSDIPADYFFTGALDNSGEKVELRDSYNNLIDSIDFSSGWPAGSASPDYVSMERINSNASGTDAANWKSNNLLARNGKDSADNKINGTPKAQNSVSRAFTEISSLPFDELSGSEIILIYQGSPYIVKSDISVPAGKTLKIEPGVVLKFDETKRLSIRGKIEALGLPDESKKIVFTANSDNPWPNFWQGVYFSRSFGNKLENVVVRYAGKIYTSPPAVYWAALQAENSELEIKNSLVENSLPGGLWMENSTGTVDNVRFSNIKNSDSPLFYNTSALLIDGGFASVKNSFFQGNSRGIKIARGAAPVIENNTFEDNGTPVFLEGTVYPVFGQNTAQNNTLNGILIDGANIVSDTVWQGNMPFVIESSKLVVFGATLTLKAGTKLQFKSKSWQGDLSVSGRLIAEGAATNTVTISGIPGVSSWKNLLFSSSGSILEGVVINNGGGGCGIGGCWGAVTQNKDVEIEIKNSWIENNAWGIFSNEPDCQAAMAKVKLENVAFSGNERNFTLEYGVLCQP